jgi:hypothetical protein
MIIYRVSQKVVTPVEIGVHHLRNYLKYWIPACAGMTEKPNFDFLRDHQYLLNF